MILALGDFSLNALKNRETDPTRKAVYSLAHTAVAGSILFCAAAHYMQVALDTVELIHEATDRSGEDGTVHDLTDKQQFA